MEKIGIAIFCSIIHVLQELHLADEIHTAAADAAVEEMRTVTILDEQMEDPGGDCRRKPPAISVWEFQPTMQKMKAFKEKQMTCLLS